MLAVGLPTPELVSTATFSRSLPLTRQIKVFRFLAGVAMLHVDWVCSVEHSAAAYLRTSREFNEITDECGDVSRDGEGEHETQELNVH